MGLLAKPCTKYNGRSTYGSAPTVSRIGFVKVELELVVFGVAQIPTAARAAANKSLSIVNRTEGNVLELVDRRKGRRTSKHRDVRTIYHWEAGRRSGGPA